MDELSDFQRGFTSSETIDFVAGSVFGYRTFLIPVLPENLHQLQRNRSYHSSLLGLWGKEWGQGWNLATCMRSCIECFSNECDHLDRSHISPHEDCTCGIYGYWKSPEPAAVNITFVAAVEAAGKVMLGTKGFRAQKSRILAISFLKPSMFSWHDDGAYLPANYRTQKDYIISQVMIELQRNYKVPGYGLMSDMMKDYPATKDYLDEEI